MRSVSSALDGAGLVDSPREVSALDVLLLSSLEPWSGDGDCDLLLVTT